jgi:hypothetical protein
MSKPIRKRIKKTKEIPVPETEEQVIDTEQEQGQVVEKEWKESFRTSTKVPPNNKFCKPCIKKNSCVITTLACVMFCDKMEIKKKRVKRQ